MKTLEEVVKQMKLEINADVVNKIVPIDVSCFEELHDYVDANEYGGFTLDNGIVDELIAAHGGRDDDGGMPDAVIAFLNEAQADVDQWIKDDGIRDYMSHDDWDAFGATEYAGCLRAKKKLAHALDTLISSNNRMLVHHALNLEVARKAREENK